MTTHRFSLLLTLPFLLMGCGRTPSLSYYKTQITALYQALKDCPFKAPSAAVSCGDLDALALAVNEKIAALRLDPQAVGLKVCALQIKIADKKKDWQQTQAEVDQYLAIIGLLEGPE